MNKKLRKRNLEVVFLCCVVILLAGYFKLHNLEKNQKIPDILFAFYGEQLSKENQYDMWYMDKSGNIYQLNSIDSCGLKTCLKQYYEMKLDNRRHLVKTIDSDVVKKKYKVLCKILRGGRNKEIRECMDEGPEVYLGSYIWFGCYYDNEGKQKAINLRGTGDSSYRNQDSRAQELADWLTECFDLKEFYKSEDDSDWELILKNEGNPKLKEEYR